MYNLLKQDSKAAIVEKVLGGISDADFPGVIAILDDESCDVLMKYIYRFLERTSNCANMLKFHSHLLQKVGIGSIVRVLTDRKTV